MVNRSSESANVPGCKLLSWSEVRARIPLSRATVWALRRRGRFPRAIQISPNRIAWREGDLDDWIKSRCADAH
jgi:prophage regulatory protein